MPDIIIYAANTASESSVNSSKTLRSLSWINTATGCNPGLNAVTYSYKVLGTNNSWVTLSPTTFS